MINWVELNEHQRQQIIESSTDLIRTLTRELGDETGIRLWEQISEVLGQDAKVDIFFGLLDESRRGVIRVKKIPIDQLIPFIKVIRNATGASLKEAKELAESIAGRYDPMSMTRSTPDEDGVVRLKVGQKYREVRTELLRMGATLA
jgi:ribosomal protein L7/L12